MGNLEKYPYSGWEPNTHIELQNIDNVTFTIGGSAALRNNFSGAAYGIKSLNSSLNIENNLFTNMVRDDDQYYRSNDGTAILASTTTGNTINIFGDNEFGDSPQAITFYGNIESEIKGNSFSNLLRGININNNSSNVTINETNTFTSVSTAVIGRNITGNFQVYGNTFENTVPVTISSMPYNSFNSTAVTLQNPNIASTGLIRVSGNTIDNYRIGIHARNIQYITIGSDLFTANYGTPNTINFGQTEFTANHRGIWLENCPDAHVQQNNISKTNPSIPFGTFTVEGIFHTLSPRGLINWNVLDQIQIPIHIRDDCSATELHCNNINNDPDPGLGVFLTSAVLPDQGSAATPWNNRWFGYDNTTFLGVNTDAPGNQFTWFYQTPGVEFNPYPDPFAALSQSTSSTGITCAVETAPDDPDRDVRYGDIVEDSLSFVDYVDEFTYKSKQYLFEQINADTNLLVRNTSKDTLFSEFYSNFKLSNIGLFLRVDSLILAGNFDTAFTLNSSILYTNQIETNQKAINGILVTKVLRDSVLNESDSTTLQEIAIQDPILGGKAVFMARAILLRKFMMYYQLLELVLNPNSTYS
ncbi:MAG: hypothetical protein IPP71_04450 [Bacteroidetes bacterium]|nr:hypothetical protein [Bacteroidota bacterium]